MFTINQPHIPDFTDPLGLLVHCHERIAGHLATLERASEGIRATDPETLTYVFAGINAASTHFAIAGVKHTEDEEISLFPRLREHGGNAGEETLAAIAELESQHREAEHLHQDLDELLRELPRDGSADVRLLDRFGELAAGLTTIYRPHIQLENNLVFPVAGRVLPASEIQALGQEMRTRRLDILRNLDVSTDSPGVEVTTLGSR